MFPSNQSLYISNYINRVPNTYACWPSCDIFPIWMPIFEVYTDITIYSPIQYPRDNVHTRILFLSNMYTDCRANALPLDFKIVSWKDVDIMPKRISSGLLANARSVFAYSPKNLWYLFSNISCHRTIIVEDMTYKSSVLLLSSRIFIWLENSKHKRIHF
jgi:hypothetical protein